MKPNFRNRFMKKLTRDRVVPTISARVRLRDVYRRRTASPLTTWYRLHPRPSKHHPEKVPYTCIQSGIEVVLSTTNTNILPSGAVYTVPGSCICKFGLSAHVFSARFFTSSDSA